MKRFLFALALLTLCIGQATAGPRIFVRFGCCPPPCYPAIPCYPTPTYYYLVPASQPATPTVAPCSKCPGGVCPTGAPATVNSPASPVVPKKCCGWCECTDCKCCGGCPYSGTRAEVLPPPKVR